MSDETKHSPEPWVYWDNGFDAGIVSEQDQAHAHAKGLSPHIIVGGEPCEGRVEADDPNVRRILACVNACAGIPTEALEAGAVRDLINAGVKLWEWDDRPAPRIPMKVGDYLWIALRRLGAIKP